MKSLLLNILNILIVPFIGKGFIDKHFPFLISLYELVYYYMQPVGFKTVHTAFNTKIKVPLRDTHVGMYLLNKGNFEALETRLISEYSKSATTILDIGANFGYYSILLGSISKDSTIYAFEPDKDNFSLLKENISLNKLQNVVIENIALFNKEGTIDFSSNHIHRGKSHVSLKDSGSYKVPSTTLDQYALSQGIKEINLLKLDVEGAEIPILQGGASILTASKSLTLFIEYNPRSYKQFGYTKKDFFEALIAVGLIPSKIIDEKNNRLLNFSQENLYTILKNSTYTNLICTKNTAITDY